ncbi:unnamed protein product [Lactuca virosa]|uniref:Uncharacterized protein n=1 Tax=Lactuca virosa TaxID=75947 RepID=A0AAU9MQ12_9ASTR|nr:unnamed protein product [Lactuca virosa]
MNTTTVSTADDDLTTAADDLTTTANDELTTIITSDDGFQIWNHPYLFSIASPMYRRHLLPPVNYRLQISTTSENDEDLPKPPPSRYAFSLIPPDLLCFRPPPTILFIFDHQGPSNVATYAQINAFPIVFIDVHDLYLS